MPMIDADGACSTYRRRPHGGPTLILSNSLADPADVGAADASADQLFRVIRYDRRGHGKSQVPPAPIRWSVSAATCSRSSIPQY